MTLMQILIQILGQLNPRTCEPSDNWADTYFINSNKMCGLNGRQVIRLSWQSEDNMAPSFPFYFLL